MLLNKKEKVKGGEPVTVKPSNNLFVTNLPAGTDDAQLVEMFESFGTIESAKVQKTEAGVPKNSGFVCFKTQEDAKKAIEAMHLKQLPSGGVLIVNYHVKKQVNEMATGTRYQAPISQNLTQTYKSNIYVKYIPSDVTEA